MKVLRILILIILFISTNFFSSNLPLALAQDEESSTEEVNPRSTTLDSGADQQDVAKEAYRLVGNAFSVADTSNSIFNIFEDYSIFSFISLLGVGFTFVIGASWLFVIIKVATIVIFAGPRDEVFEKAVEDTQNFFRSIGWTFAFPIAISIGGFAVGIGSVFQWPSGLRECYGDDGSGETDYTFFFQAVIGVPEDTDVDQYCFGRGTPNIAEGQSNLNSRFSVKEGVSCLEGYKGISRCATDGSNITLVCTKTSESGGRDLFRWKKSLFEDRPITCEPD